MVVGQSIEDARVTLGKVPGVQQVEIKPFPSIIPRMPFQQERITVSLQPGTTK